MDYYHGRNRPNDDPRFYQMGRKRNNVSDTISRTYGVKDVYANMDSHMKLRPSELHDGKLSFNIQENGTTSDQTIGITNQLTMISGVEVGTFTIPLPSNDIVNAATEVIYNSQLSSLNLENNGNLATLSGDTGTNASSQIPYGRITMLINEISRQSISDSNHKSHHFEFTVSLTGPGNDRLMLTPVDHSKLYIFVEPIQSLQHVSLNLYNNHNVLRLPPDVLHHVGVRTVASGPKTYLEFTFTDNSNLINIAAGDRIFIENFDATVNVLNEGESTSTTTSYSLLNQYINRDNGHVVGDVPATIVTNGPGTSGWTPSEGTSIAFRLNPAVRLDSLTIGSVPAPSAGVTWPDEVVTGISPNQITYTYALGAGCSIRIAKNRVNIPLRFRCIDSKLTNFITP